MSLLRTIVSDIEDAGDALKNKVSDALGLQDTPLIAPYRGFGTAKSIWVRARVLEDEGVISALHDDNLATNLRHTFKRYETDEISGATVAWSFGDDSGTVVTDAEGYVDFTIEPSGELPNPTGPNDGWHDVHLELIEAPGYETAPLGATVRVRVPRTDARFAVISDIDDTIVKTGATNFVKHWRTVVANSAQSRSGYDTLPDLYTALSEEGRNPFFYVSSSPWNLFDLFERYMVLNGIPLGPMLLKDFGLDDDKWLTGGHDGHKTKMIERVLNTYPRLSVVLVGDSGQRDLAIYRKIVEAHPGRVAAVAIHDVTDGETDPQAEADLAAIREAGLPAIRTDDYALVWDMLHTARLVSARALGEDAAGA